MLSKLFQIYKLSFGTLALTCILECISWRKVKELNSNTYGKENYKKALYLNLKNKLIISPPIYFVATMFFSKPNGLGNEILQVLGILIIQSIGYFSVHKWMHNPQIYWIHEFHHRFSRIVTPVVANAVSYNEYIYAYICPIFIGVAGISPSQRAANVSIAIISIGNLLIHFENVEELSIRYVPDYFVSTFLHLEHHRKHNRNFAAPIINVDKFFYNSF
tara:strand:- start:895 stop:1548 length:654 start_codon:yes stop_codon:yes gene_type:complete